MIFSVIALYSLVDGFQLSEVHAASIFRVEALYCLCNNTFIQCSFVGYRTVSPVDVHRHLR
jgi:hypothetical protein